MSEEKKVMCHAFLISYAHPAGFGSLVNYREIGATTAKPSVEDLESILSKVADRAGISAQKMVALSVSELQDQMVSVSMVSGYHEDIAKD